MSNTKAASYIKGRRLNQGGLGLVRPRETKLMPNLAQAEVCQIPVSSPMVSRFPVLSTFVARERTKDSFRCNRALRTSVTEPLSQADVHSPV